MDVTRIRNPRALSVPVVLEYLDKALNAHKLWCNGPIDSVAPRLADIIADPEWGVFLAHEGMDFTGLCVIMPASPPDVPYPQVCHFYSSAKGAKAALVRKMVEFIQEAGYTTFWAINATDTPDSIWKRAFKKAGEATRIGSIMEFKTETE